MNQYSEFATPYVPKSPPIKGHAFSAVFRIFATALVMGLLIWGLKLAMEIEQQELDRNVLSWGIAGLMLMLSTWWILISSQVTVSATEITQTWFWKKSAPLNAIGYAKFMRFKGWEWLIAPRLYVRTGPGPFKTFYAATPELWTEFEALSSHHRAHNPM